MTEDKKAKNIYQKLIEVSKAIEYLEKDKSNKMQGYKYLSEAKVKEVIKKQFEIQGIVFNYSTEEVREYEISPTSKGTRQFLTVAKGTYHFIDTNNPGEAINGTWFGTGNDTGDKGLYKAITGGIKYVLNTNFLIPSGDDPENDSNGVGGAKDKKIEPRKEYTGDNKSQKLVTEKQLKRYYAMVKEAGLDIEAADEHLKKKYKVEHKSDLTMAQIDEVFTALEKKIQDKKDAEQIDKDYTEAEQRGLI
ncbi:MAG: ERF family protein [Atribacterota bacterium]|nr:ERF family protein [Atribacterota bacterium]